MLRSTHQDPTATTPVNKFVYINMDPWNEVFQHVRRLSPDNWGLIIDTLNMVSHLSTPDPRFANSAYARYQHEFGFCMFDNFDCALAYLDNERNGLLIKIEKPHISDIHLENIDWLYAVSNLRETFAETDKKESVDQEDKADNHSTKISCSFFRNESRKPQWHSTWEKFNNFSLPLCLLKQHAEQVREACDTFLSKHAHISDLYAKNSHISYTKVLHRATALILKSTDVSINNYFIFYVSLCTISEQLHNQSLHKDLRGMTKTLNKAIASAPRLAKALPAEQTSIKFR